MGRWGMAVQAGRTGGRSPVRPTGRGVRVGGGRTVGPIAGRPSQQRIGLAFYRLAFPLLTECGAEHFIIKDLTADEKASIIGSYLYDREESQ